MSDGRVTGCLILHSCRLLHIQCCGNQEPLTLHHRRDCSVWPAMSGSRTPHISLQCSPAVGIANPSQAIAM